MFKKLKDFLLLKKNQLFITSSGKQIGRFAVLLILLLDLQVLYLVIDGASRAADFITYPENPVPTACDFLYNRYLNSTNLEQINFIRQILSRSDNYDGAWGFVSESNYLNDSNQQDINIAQGCVKARHTVKDIQQDKIINDQLLQVDINLKKISDHTSRISTLKESYDSALLEKISGQTEKESILPARAGKIREQIDLAEAKIKTLLTLNAQSIDLILKSKAINKLTALVSDTSLKNTLSIKINEYLWAVRTYPVKRLGLAIIFLLPLVVMAILWNARARRKDNSLQIMASAHMILVVTIPILLKFGYFLYDLIPHTFFSRLFDFLAELNISFLWNYIVILITVLVFGLAIWASQKFIYNSKRRQKNRIKHKECCVCEERLESFDLNYCYFCGSKQQKECCGCKKLVNVNFLCCPSCGIENS